MKTGYQRFEAAWVWRSELHPHERNPRMISESAARKLKAKMKKVGLVQPIAVNRRPDGRLVVLGGHQRLAAMDSLERYRDGKNDYELQVALSVLPEKDELEMLVFLNNPSAMGAFDPDILADLSASISFEDMGFDSVDVDLLFDGDARFSELYTDSAEVSETKSTLDEIKAHRKESTQRLKEENKADFYFTVVCKNQSEKDEVLRALHLPKYEMFVSGDTLLAAVGNVQQ